MKLLTLSRGHGLHPQSDVDHLYICLGNWVVGDFDQLKTVVLEEGCM